MRIKKAEKEKIIKAFFFMGILVLAYLFFGSGFNKKDDPILIIDRVDKLMVLPSDEIPTVLDITDINTLKDKPFFQKAEIGFKVLVYAKSGKSILYDPKNNKIVEIGVLNSFMEQESI